MEAVGRLAGGVAHDFNNMLSVIMLSLEMAQSALDPSHPAAADLDEIHDAAQRSAELTRQLLAFARRQPAALEPVDVNDVVRGGLSMLGRLIGENITLASDVANRPLRVLADRAQLTQIVTNLVVNARDAIDGVGTVRISTGAVTVDEPFCATRPDARPGAYVQLLVADNGAGMDKSVLDRIFEPFFTTKGAHGPKAGTGLGLATVYGIVRQNGGFIDVTSEPGAGSAFTIYWPELSAPVAAATPETRHKATRGRETILLVEDEPALLKLTTKVLTAFGYRVMSARTPQEALDLSNRVTERIDLLLTDVILPEMNGRELSERLRAHRPGLKCLFTSGYTADHIGTHGVLDPGVDFIAKPWTNDSLGMKLREVLDQV
jgi:CheY-like chemotaxis protein